MFDFAGIRIGHTTYSEHNTGCTVFLCPAGTYGSVDARGPAPGSRELALLAPDKPDDKEVNAILLTGGSAFGLAAADGVMRRLAELGIGHPTPIRPVPIVPAAVVFDMGVASSASVPDADGGYAACIAAESFTGEVEQGNVGVGAGVLVGKWAGFPCMMKGGFGVYSMRVGDVVVAAAAAVNAVGDVVNADGTVLAGARNPEGGWMVDQHALRYVDMAVLPPSGTNTTLVVVATNADLSRSELARLTHQAHNGMAISVRPSHTRHDGDMAFALSTRQVSAEINLVNNMAVAVVSEAIRNGVRHAAGVFGIPGLADKVD
ncbi:MAG: P1 family peptidase [Candidatus Promineofilum sp.]|nr:P1 family peptidase [Promineifilum sp.]MBP9657484.1 P1 family peptidase [Promineifilum sp.]